MNKEQEEFIEHLDSRGHIYEVVDGIINISGWRYDLLVAIYKDVPDGVRFIGKVDVYIHSMEIHENVIFDNVGSVWIKNYN